MYSLGLFVSSTLSEDVRFAPNIIERFEQEELSITGNGTAHIIGGSSLIVAVRSQKYDLQGLEVDDEKFWNWMFRLLCCLRECFILGGICSTELRNLGKRYENLRNKIHLLPCNIWKLNDLGKKLAQISYLLFVIEESVNSVTSSKMAFVQEKLNSFIERMGLSFLIENLNKRRFNLDSRLSQDKIERSSLISLGVASLAVIIAMLTL